MRTIFLIIILICAMTLNAQIKIVEDFENGATLGWEEFSNKTGSAIIKEGFIELKSHKKRQVAATNVKLPINGNYDFKITAKILIPKFNKKMGLDIFFLDSNLKPVFFAGVTENRLFSFVDQKPIQSKIKLPKGNDKIIEFVIEFIGNDVTLTVDNVELIRTEKNGCPELIGFDTNTLIKIDEVIIEQEYTGDSEEE